MKSRDNASDNGAMARASILALKRGAIWRGPVLAAWMVTAIFTGTGHAASGKQPPPPDAPANSPPQYTRFTTGELQRGFLALAFGSDLRIGARPRGIRRFDRPIGARIIDGGSVTRTVAMAGLIEEYARQIPALRLSVVAADRPADIEIRLIDEKDFSSALRAAFGRDVARTFIRRTNPQCMTSVKSEAGGTIVRAVSFIIVDKGERVFRDCAYHELLHAFGLSNHDQRNPWTTLNQTRTVGYLTVYDHSLVTLLYDPVITPGMARAQVRAALPKIITRLGLAAPPARR